MKIKTLIALICSLSCFYIADAQKALSLKDIKQMMEAAREPKSLPYMLILTRNDTILGNDLDKKWNKKTKEAEWKLDGKSYKDDSTYFYQDKDGFHEIFHYKFGTQKINMDCARIIKGDIDLFVTNWEPRGSTSTFNPGFTPGSNRIDPSKAGYKQGKGSSSPLQYYLRKNNGNLKQLTYKSLKEHISDNKAALDQYNAEVKPTDVTEKSLSDWGMIKRIMDIYNQ